LHPFNKKTLKSDTYSYKFEILISILFGIYISFILKGLLTPILFFGKGFGGRNLLFQLLMTGGYALFFTMLSFLSIYLMEQLLPWWNTQCNSCDEKSIWFHLRKTKFPVVSTCFLILVPLIAHFLFSSLGFNPTDDGFTLAYSRRIIEGQIPHRDFIIIRPFLSPLLHVPFVLLGGDYTFLFSRLFVWFQLACVSWIWIILLEKRFMQRPFHNFEKVCLALISFATSAHTFPVMAWHTIDGLFLISIGLLFCVTENSLSKFAGYLIIGLSYLCKQSFIFVAPLTIIILGDWRRIKLWLAILTPGVMYLLFLLCTNAIPDAFVQLLSHKDSFLAINGSYFDWEMMLGILIGTLSTHLIIEKELIKTPFRKDLPEWVGLLMLSVIPMIGISISLISDRYRLISYGIFGLVLGVVNHLFIKRLDKTNDQIRIALIALLLAWSSSLSIGYNMPILASGQLLSVLLAFSYPFFKDELEKHFNRPIYTVTLFGLTAIVLLFFGLARFHSIYREDVGLNLTENLDAVLPGGKGIRTNENTFSFLNDLREAARVSQTFGATYTILPDCAGWWVKSQETNPISIDWPQDTELSSTESVDRVVKELESMRKSNIIIVQKFEANKLAGGFFPLGKGYSVVNYVRDNFSLVYETPYFLLYR
jgi:hypothetical protein